MARRDSRCTQGSWQQVFPLARCYDLWIKSCRKSSPHSRSKMLRQRPASRGIKVIVHSELTTSTIIYLLLLVLVIDLCVLYVCGIASATDVGHLTHAAPFEFVFRGTAAARASIKYLHSRINFFAHARGRAIANCANCHWIGPGFVHMPGLSAAR